MTTDLKRLMHHAAADAPLAHRLVADAHLGARRIRRRRTAFAAVTATTALGATGLLYRAGAPSTADTGPAAATSTDAAYAATAQPASPQQSAAAGALPDCDGSMGSTPRDIAAGELAVRLLSSDPAYRLEWVQAAEMTSDCIATPAALVLTDAGTDGVIRRAVTVWGPRRTPMSYGHYLGTVTHATVRGVDAQLMAFEPGSDGPTGLEATFRLAWTEPSGQSWEITGSGLSAAELEATAESLAIDGGSAALRAVPDGFHLDTKTDSAPASPKQKEWFVAYQTAADRLLLRTAQHPGLVGESVSLGAPGMWRVTTVRGHQALAVVKDQLLVHLSWEEAPGVQVSLSAEKGATPAAALVAFADSLRPAEPGDPRIGLKLRSALGTATPPPLEEPSGSASAASAQSAKATP